ncbi:MAG: cation transporter [Acidimicrobiia bacterium]|nr:cation transporter [Acidimicrobiia bacterium]
MTTSPSAGASHAAQLRRRAVLLAWATVAWNLVEAVVAIWAGRRAGSMALVGFGLDSTIEVASALVILWQFAGRDEQRERLALKLIGVSFFALAAYVSVQSVLTLVTATRPDVSIVGITLAALSLVVMPLLAHAKRRTGQQLGSATVTADSQQTWLCTYLSAVLLAGLALNATLGWWWADPLAGLAIAGLAVREGREAWAGDPCCD